MELELILQQITLWMPTITSIAGIVITVICTIYKVLKAINEFKDRNKEQIQALIDDDEKLKADMQSIIAENRELKKTIGILVDKLTHIDGYVEAKLNESKHN